MADIFRTLRSSRRWWAAVAWAFVLSIPAIGQEQTEPAGPPPESTSRDRAWSDLERDPLNARNAWDVALDRLIASSPELAIRNATMSWRHGAAEEMSAGGRAMVALAQLAQRRGDHALAAGLAQRVYLSSVPELVRLQALLVVSRSDVPQHAQQWRDLVASGQQDEQFAPFIEEMDRAIEQRMAELTRDGVAIDIAQHVHQLVKQIDGAMRLGHSEPLDRWLDEQVWLVAPAMNIVRTPEPVDGHLTTTYQVGEFAPALEIRQLSMIDDTSALVLVERPAAPACLSASQVHTRATLVVRRDDKDRWRLRSMHLSQDAAVGPIVRSEMGREGAPSVVASAPLLNEFDGN